MKLSTYNLPLQSRLLARQPLRMLARQAKRQRGFVMVMSMLILLIITVISISMAKSFFLEEGMAGNIREKNRAFVAAQAALEYGQWLANTQGGTPVPCVGYSGAQTTPIVCSYLSPALNLSSPPMATWVAVTPYYMTATESVSGFTGGTDTYYAKPGVYVQAQSVPGYFQITAFGYGGSASSLTILQTMYTNRPCNPPQGSLVAGC